MTRALIAGPELKVQGMPWQQEPILRISADALTAKVLCRRHNAALSPLDSEAAHVFETIREARWHATKPSLSRRNLSEIVSGEAIELWALKTMAGVWASGMDFQFGDYRLRDFEIPMARIAEVLGSAAPHSFVSLEIPVQGEEHEPTLGRSAVTILWEIDDEERRLTAFVVRMHGLALKFHLPGHDGIDSALLAKRPHMLDFIGPLRRSRLYFGWPEARKGGYVFIRMKAARATPDR